MTIGQFFSGVFYSPAWIFSGLTNLFLGSFKKEQGRYVTDEDGKYETNPGLFALTVDAIKWGGSFILDASKYVARTIADFISNHQQAIAIAFWASLAVAAAAALTVAFWPAALAAVTGFSIYGVSIATVVGTGFAAQVAATAGLAAIATSATVYISAAVVNAISDIVGFFTGPKKPNAFVPSTEPQPSTELNGSKLSPFAGLNAQPTDKKEISSTSEESSSEESSSEEKVVSVKSENVTEVPVHTASIFQPAGVITASEQPEFAAESTASATLPQSRN